MKKLSDRQQQWLKDVHAKRNPLDRFRGRSEFGGASSIHSSLMRRGLIELGDDGVRLTAAGNAILKAESGVPR